MRETFSLRGAHMRALLGFISISIIAECTQHEARADDSTTAIVDSPPKRTFGEKGNVVFPLVFANYEPGVSPQFGAGPLALSYQSTSDGNGGRVNTTSFDIEPEADFFIARHFSIGGKISFAYTRTKFDVTSAEIQSAGGVPVDDGYITAGVLPRIGYAFPIGAHVAIWPRLGAGMDAVDHVAPNAGPVATPFVFRAELDAAFIYRVDKMFFVAFDPQLFVSGAPKLTTDDSSEFQSGIRTQLLLGLVL